MEQKKEQRQQAKEPKVQEPAFGKHFKEAAEIVQDWWKYRQPAEIPMAATNAFSGMTLTTTSPATASQSYMASAVVKNG